MSTTMPVTAKQGMPPYAYFLAAGVCGIICLAGHAVQIQTDEAWFSGANAASQVLLPHFSVFGQIFAFWDGGLPKELLGPYVFAWTVQAAQVAMSIGVELPKHTKEADWRSKLCGGTCVILIAINSYGDYLYVSEFGIWSQIGFAFALFVATFCFGMLTIIAIQRGIDAMHIRRLP